MPKSKREKVLHLSQVSKKTRENKDRLFALIRAAMPEYQYCFVVRVDNMRNTHLKELRQEMQKDSRIFLGKTKLMARALGTTPAEAQADGIDSLASRYLHGNVGLLFTNRKPDDVREYLDSLAPVDFSRAGAVATEDVVVPRGVLYSTAGRVPQEYDVPIATALDPELRRLGIPTRLQGGKVILEEGPADSEAGTEGYVICREGQTLDARQTRLLRLFSVCLSEFRVSVQAYWTATTGEVTEVEAPPAIKKAAEAADASAVEDVEVSDA